MLNFYYGYFCNITNKALQLHCTEDQKSKDQTHCSLARNSRKLKQKWKDRFLYSDFKNLMKGERQSSKTQPPQKVSCMYGTNLTSFLYTPQNSVKSIKKALFIILRNIGLFSMMSKEFRIYLKYNNQSNFHKSTAFLFTKRKLGDVIMAFKKNYHQVMLDKYTESKFCFINIKLTRISQRHRRALNCKIHETSYKTTIK